MDTDNQIDTEQLLKKLRTSFVFFCHALWKICGYQEVAPIEPADEDMMRWMDGEDASNRRGCLGPRGIGKTYISIAMCAFRHFQNPEVKILFISKTEQHAKESSTLLRGWYDRVAFLRHLSPDRSVGHRDTRTAFDVGACKPRHRTPSFSASGITGQLEGRRAHIIIADDVETEENTISLDRRETLDRRVREFGRITTYDTKERPGGHREVVFIGTYHHDDSVYLKLAKRGYHFRTWPILYPSDQQRWDDDGQDRILNLAPQLIDALTEGKSRPGDKVWPRRHSDQYLSQQRAEGESGWEMHQMLTVLVGDQRRYPLRCKDLLVLDPMDMRYGPIRMIWASTDTRSKRSTVMDDIQCVGFGEDCFHAAVVISQQTEYSPYDGTIMYIDPSGKGVDRTAYAIVSHLCGYIFLKSIGSLDGGYDDDVLTRLALIARDTQTNRIVVEQEWGGGMFVNLLRQKIQDMHAAGAPTSPIRDVSGPNAVEDQRKHTVEKWTGQWSCTVDEDPIAKRNKRKEWRILDTLEPVVQTHRMVISRQVAENHRFQTQFTRICREEECLPHEDELDALAGAVSQWKTSMDVNQEDLQGITLDRQIDEFREDQRILSDVVTGPTTNQVWFSHV